MMIEKVVFLISVLVKLEERVKEITMKNMETLMRKRKRERMNKERVNKEILKVLIQLNIASDFYYFEQTKYFHNN